MVYYGDYESVNCTICGTSHTIGDTRSFLKTLKLEDASSELLKICPKCIATIYLEAVSKNIGQPKPVNTTSSSGSYKPSVSKPSRFQQRLREMENQRSNARTQQAPQSTPDFDKPVNPPVIKPFKKFLAVFFTIVSLAVLAYSLIIKYIPDAGLPSFPFFPYVLGFSFLVFFIGNSRSNAIFGILILVNFFTPHFRNVFYSHFDLGIMKFVFTLLFISSFFALTTLFQLFYTNFLLPKHKSITVKIYSVTVFKALVPSLILYFAVMSPFYLGAIEPVSDKSVSVDKIQSDPIFDVLTSITSETADIEIARQYFSDGKEATSMGTVESLKHSIELYEMALVLVPEFSTAYAEIAYSYGSLYRIEKSKNKKSVSADEYMNKAILALDAAFHHNPNNYTSYAIESMLNYFTGNENAAKASINKAIKLMGDNGKNERILEAMSFLEKKKIQSLNYLITIQDRINSNSAEIHNLLAVKYWEVGNVEKTREMAERAILLSPKYDEPYLNIALTLEEKPQVLEQYDKVIKMQSDYADLAVRFKKIINWQAVLKVIFWILFPFAAIQFLYMQGMVMQGNMAKEKMGSWVLRYMFVFGIVFGSFIIYINRIFPVDSLTHQFPIKFPFF